MLWFSRWLLLLRLLYLNGSTAWIVPQWIRLNAQGQPRCTLVVEGTLHLVTRVALGPQQPVWVQVQAASNRAVLQGQLDSLHVRIDNARRSPLLRMEQLELSGRDLRLGYLPLFLACLPAVLCITRPPTLWTLAGIYLVQRRQRVLNEFTLAMNKITNRKSTVPQRRSERHWAQRWGAKPCHLDYRLTLTNQDLSQSFLFRQYFQWIFQHIMSKSVIPSMLLQLSSSFPTVLPVAQRNSLGQWIAPDHRSHDPTTFPPMTTYSLRHSPMLVSSGNKLIFPGRVSTTSMPSSSSSPSKRTSSLDFDLRATLTTTGPKEDGKLALLSPECRFDLKSCWPGLLSQSILPHEVWIPVGMLGVAVGGAGKVRSVDVNPSNHLRIEGQIALFGNHDNNGDDENSNTKNVGGSAGGLTLFRP